MKPHKKVIYIGFGGFAVVKAFIFFFGIIAGIFGIGNVFADSDCSTLTSENLNTCCMVYSQGYSINCSPEANPNRANKISRVELDALDDYAYEIHELNFSGNNLYNIDFINNIIETYDRVPINTLNFYNNKITDISPILNLYYLQNIYFGGNNIQDISSITSSKSLLNLKKIDLSNNRIKKYPYSLKAFSILEELNFNNNYVSNLPEFPTSLQNLSLSSNGITGFSILSGLGRIQLNLSNNEISDITQIPKENLGLSNLSNNCIDIELNSEIIKYLSDEWDNEIGPQHTCSDWTGQDVTLTTYMLIDNLNLEIEEGCNTEKFYICNNENDNICNTENTIFSGDTYNITCNSGEICKNDLSFFFLSDELTQCMVGNMSVWIDKVPPTCIIDQGGQKTGNDFIIYRPTNHDVQLTIYAEDEEGIGKIDYEGYKRNNDEWSSNNISGVSENGNYFVKVRDAVGNETGCSITVSNIDREPPAPATGNESMCFSGSTNIVFSETNHETGSGFGGSYIVYSTGDTQLSCSSEIWENGSSKNFIETTDVHIGVCDEAGNITTGEYTYARDRAPITTATGYNRQWTGNNVLLTFDIDDGHKLCKKTIDSKTYYCMYTSGESECSDMSIGENTNVNCGTGSVCQTYIKYYSVNGSGMTESTKTGLVKIDKEAPSCNISPEPGTGSYTSGSVVLSAIANDGIGSNNIQYNWASVFGSNTQSGVSSNGNYSLTVKDLVGNEKSCKIEVSNIDKTKPTITTNPGNDNSAKKSREITIIANDNLAGFIGNQNFKYYWSDVSTCTTNENSYTQTKNFDSYVIGSTTIMGSIKKSDGDGQKYLCIFGGIQDRAGNISITSKKGPYLFDNTGPTGNIQISYNGNTLYASGYKFELTLTGSDSYSAISGMQFSCNNTNWTNIETFTENKSFNLSEYKNFGCNTGDGEKKIYVKFIDSLGNIGGTISGNIILDTTAPNCTISQSACTSGNLLLTLTGNETITGSNLNNWTFVNNSKYTIGVSSNNTVSVIISDLAGNIKNCTITPTNYDKDGPSITFENTEIDECTSKTWSANAEDIGCAGITANSAFNFSTINFGNGTRGGSTFNISKELVLSGGTTKTQTLIVRDTLGNENTKAATLTIKDTKPSIGNITGEIPGLLTGDIIYGNIVSILNVQDGACGTGTITGNLVGECTNASQSNIQNNILTIKPNQNMEGTGICTIEFRDDEGNSITGFVTYNIDTRRPEKAVCTENACFKDIVTVSCSESVAEPGNKIVYSTSNDISCNSPIRSGKSFSSSTTFKVAVCDSVGHISEIDTYSYLLDNESPSTTLSGLPTGWTGSNLNLGIDVQDNCEKADTYYCIVDKGDSNCSYTKATNNNIEVSCDDGDICEKELRYYSKDDAGNQENTKIENIQIDRKELTCEITFDDNICTNSDINLTLNISKPIINDLGSRSMDPDNSNKYYRTINWDGEISVDVYDHINNAYTCTAYVNNFDENTPIVYTQDLYTGYECEDISISPIVSDEGCSNNSLTYIWDNITGDTAYLANWENSNSLDINNIDLKVIDTAGNNTNKEIKYQWINIPITGQDFEIDNVGTGISVNWKQKAGVHAGTCEYGLIEANLANSGTMGDCILNGDILQYLPYTGMIGNDICTLSISDGDGDIAVSAIWKGIDNDRPIVIEYTGGFGDICTIQQDTDIILSFSEGVEGITEESLTGYNINIINFSSGDNGSEYLWNIRLTGEGTGEVWIINPENIKDAAGNSLSGSIEHMYLGYYDVIGPTTPSLLNYTGGEISENASITIQWQDSSTTGCAILEKYEIIVCTGINMSEGCKTYESYTNKKTIVKENGEYYRKVIAIDSNDNRSDFEMGHFEINSNNPTCIIESFGTCTSGSIELQLTATEPISFLDMGGITWTGSGKIWSGLINENRIINGIIIQDDENNTGTCDEFVISSFDNQAPSTSISGDLVQIDEKYWSKDNVNLEFLAADEGCGNGEIDTYYCISDTDECTDFEHGNNITVTGDDGNISTKNIKYYSVDIAGNKENDKSIEITIDKQGPACEIDKNITTNTNDSILITISGHDNTGIGLNQFPYAWYPEKIWINQPMIVIWGNGLYTGYVRDLLGNESMCDIDIQNIDTIPPEGVRCNIESNSCFSDSLSVICEEISNNDEGNTIVYTTDGTEPTCLSESGNDFSFTGDTILKIAVCDSVNNISDISTYTYLVDNEKPNTSIEGLPSGNGWVGNNLTISLSGFDYGCAGGTESHYCLYDSGDSCNTFTTGTEVSVSCNTGDTCIKYLEYYSIDTLGNVENTKRHVIKIDKQGPTCEINQTPASGFYTNGIVVLDANGNDGVGIKSYVWSGNWGKQKRLSVSTNGEYSVTITDTLGNQSQCSINVANIDKTAPNGVQCTPNNLCHSGNVNISCNENEHENGNYIVYTVDGTSPNCNSTSGNNISITGDNVVNVAVCDKAKNISNISTYNYNLDKKAPNTTINGVSDDWVGNNVAITLAVSDSGCANGIKTYYCIDTGNLCNPNISGKNVTISCSSGDICQKYIRYYSVDALGNKENIKYKLAKINKSILSCDISYDTNICSNSGIVVHLSTSEPIAGLSGWRQIDLKNYEKVVSHNGKISATLNGALGGFYSCEATIDTYDNIPPTLHVNDEYHAYKCENINIIASGYDSGCQGNNLKYMWNNQTGTSDKTIPWDSESKSNQEYTINISISDAAGNTTDKNIKYRWINTGITLNTDTLNLQALGSGETGFVMGKRELISYFGVNEGMCGSGNISINTGSCDNTTFIIDGDFIKISYENNQSISCNVLFDNGDGLVATGKIIYSYTGNIENNLTGWDNDKFLDEDFWNNYVWDSTTGHNQIIYALYGNSEDYETAYSLGRSGYNESSCTGMIVIETGILPNNLLSNTIYVLNTGKVIITNRINMGKCSAIVSKNGTIIYSDKYFDENHEATMTRTEAYSIMDNLNFDGINNGTGGNHTRNYHGIDVYSDSTLNNVKSYHNGYGIVVEGRHININNVQTFGNDVVGILESSHLHGTNTYNTYNNIQSYNNKDAGFNLEGLNTVLNNTMVYNNGNDTGSISWDSLTNPKDKNGKYLINWTKSGLNNAKGLKTIGEIEGYSYGIGIKTQQQPVVYVGNTLMSGGNYDKDRYIGSNVKKATGSLDIIYNDGDLNFIGKSNNVFVNKYGLFLIGNTNTGVVINETILGKVAGIKDNGYQYVVTQLFGNNYFATHFVTDIDLSYTQPKYEKFVPDRSKYDRMFSDEMNEAYQYSYEYKITTMPTILSADMYGNLTRIAMAKMISNYAINILGETPDSTKYIKFSDVSDNLDYDYDYGVQKAYQLGIMGQNMPNNKFRPYDLVTRAEFATALSRLLFHMEDGKIKYYEPHIYILKTFGIISDTNPDLQERRGYVMLMLLRYHQHNSR